MVQQAAPARIKVIPDTRTSSLFVAAALSDIPLVIDVLKQIDSRTTTTASNIKFFKLKNLDATQVVENLREVLNVQSGPRNRRPGTPNQPGQPPGQPDQGQQPQVIQMQGQPGQGATVSPSDNISLTADPQTNSIIAKAPLESLDLIASLIKEMDESDNTMKSEMRRVHLEHARATEIATIVKDVTSKMAGIVAGGPGPRGARTNPGVSVNADPRTNSVILFGQTKDLDQTDKIIKEMDIDAVGGTIRQFPVKGDATTIANAIKTIFVTGQQTDIVITADTSTSTILVKAPGPQMTEIAEQIKAMEEKIAGSTGVRMIKLTVANAETVAEKMQSIFADARNRSGGRQTISIKGNKSNSTLYVSGADDDIYKTIETVAHDMDKAPLDFMVKAFKLKHASAVDVNQKLTEMMIKASQTDVLKGSKLDLVGVVPDARTNALIVTGGPITFGLIGSILDQVDLEAKDSLRFAKTYSLPPSVDATQVASNIQVLLSSPTAQSMGQEPPTVSANPGANVVIINANAKQHEEIKKTILDPMVASVGKGPPETRFVELKHGRADEIARAMLDSIRNTTVANAKGQFSTTVTAEPTSNKLIVTAPSDKFKDVMKMIEALDSAGEGVRKESTITVVNTSPADVARSLQQVFNASVQGKPGRTAPTIQEVPGSTHIIVMANDSELDQIKNLVQQIDKEGSKGRMVHTVPLPDLIPAKSVAENIKQLFGSNKEDGVKAEYHEPTNTLLVRATDDEFKRINEQVIQNLQNEKPIGVLKIYKMPLKYAVADEVAKTLQDFFDKKSGVSRNTNNNLPPWMRGGEPAAKQLDNQVTITAETSSNMLLVYCTETTKELIDGIIKDITRHAAGRQERDGDGLAQAAPRTCSAS
jgi:type II secretory pathway component GspD/PulD (secretin)